ncbi:uncharacterized protein LOC143881465 [Tasmannia lanceolata]|uniref:uncharacterized protein LOC143881465 n=1 Tax=Tasmannia lanceolata TaxID=3420 RepID=UPI004064C860
MEVTMEVDDDLFFADLSKRISLLIMEEEADDSSACSSSASLHAFSHPIGIPFAYEKTYIRESKGTGVFIPQSFVPRRKRRSGRFASFNTNSYRQYDKSREVSHGSNKDNLCCNYCNPRVKRT